ncbi:MAG TPA: AI-2E family transporter [Thermomicrobiales bacterium]|nr:AI-2E family transporter [Thermomicrobiales bacterium]
MQQYMRNVWDHTRNRLGVLRKPIYGPPAPMDVPTPIIVSHRMRSIILIVAFLGLVWLAAQVPSILQLLFIGATVSLILSFPVGFMQRFMPRGLAVTIVTVSLLVFVLVLLALLIPFLINEITQFAESLPSTVDSLQTLLNNALDSMYERGWLDQHPETVMDDIEEGLFDAGQEIATTVIGNVLATLTASVNVLITAFGVTFIAIYLLVDIPRFKNSYLRLWAPKYRHDANVLWDTVGYSLSRYLGGLLISITLQGVLAWIGLMIIGVPYALILGLFVAATAILPYIGAWISAIPAVLVALTISWQHALAVAILYVLINQIEGNLITPRIQGSAVRVHPLLIFLGVIAGSRMFGAIGAIMAVPVIAVLRVVLEFFWLRLHVDEDRDTVLSVMRADAVQERIAAQSPIADLIEDEADRRRETVASIGPTAPDA